MAYYDRLVRDPNAALGEIAQRRNISRDELLNRLSAVRAAAQSGEHLTLGQASSFFDDDQSPPAPLAAHVDACAYCQAILDSLQPQRVQRNAQRLQQEIAAEAGGKSLSGILASAASVGSRWGQPVATAAIGFALAVAVVPNTLAPYFDTPADEVARLRAENLELRTLNEWSAAPMLALELAANSDVHGEWKVVNATPNAVGGTSLQLRRTDGGKETTSMVALTPGDDVLLFNLKKNAAPDKVDVVSN